MPINWFDSILTPQSVNYLDGCQDRFLEDRVPGQFLVGVPIKVTTVAFCIFVSQLEQTFYCGPFGALHHL